MIIFLSPLDYRTGYGIDACQKMIGLLNRGHEVFIRCTKAVDHVSSIIPIELEKRRIVEPHHSTEWEVMISPPCRMYPTKGKKTVMVTTFETDKPPPGFMQQIAPKTEAIIVPSLWNKHVLRAAGYDKPVFVLPESVDSRFRYRLPPKNRVFQFGSICTPRLQDGDRKGIADMVIAFQKAFGKDYVANLNIKISDHANIPKLPYDARVRYLVEDWTVEKLVGFLHQQDAYVSASAGEAWGRCLHEAMATGKTCIATDFGGHKEFFDETVGIVVPSEIRQAGEGYAFGKWGAPIVGHLSHAMQRVQQSKRFYRIVTGAAAARRANLFSQDVCAEAMENILIELGAIKRPTKPKKLAKTRDPYELITRHYLNREPVPRAEANPPGNSVRLSNEPPGIGDWLVLTQVSKTWWDMGMNDCLIYHPSQSFSTIGSKAFNSTGDRPGESVSAWRLIRKYNLGNGHFTQRMHRAFGLKAPLLPKPVLKGVGGKIKFNKVPGLTVIHTEAGIHADWQRRTVHPRAREVYPENKRVIEKVIKDRGLNAIQIGGGEPIRGAIQLHNISLTTACELLESAEYFIGIMSGPMHMATAYDCKCIVIINFPDPNQIFLPVLKDIPLIEAEWFYPQHCYLHQDGSGPLVPKFSRYNLNRAIEGGVYPFWKQEYLQMIEMKV